MSGLELSLIFVVPILFPFDYRTWIVTDLIIVSYTTVTVTYIVIICMLIRTLNKVKDFFKREYRIIVWQFVLFLLGDLSVLILQGAFMYGDMENWTDFTYTLMQACSHFTLDIVPVAFMIYCHHRTFSNEAEVHETVETQVSTKMMSSKDTSRFATS